MGLIYTNLKIIEDGKYVLIEDYREGWEPFPLMSISPASNDKTDSLYLFWMSGPRKKFYDTTSSHTLIIDGVDLV